MNYIVYTDGGARGNPGPAGIGFVIVEGNITVKRGHAHIGETTNNQAEYEALIRALTELDIRMPKKGREEHNVEVRMDSELVIKQLRHEYKVKDVGLKLQFAKVDALLSRFPHVTFKHIFRAQNAEADALANEAMDVHHTSK
ncbi:MAG: ribonuclease HI family protein [Candidatus Campbellbacteria bacterium]|nr:ribonuclease HI family protein [Candidatus Campbellbacteria bacterium]